MAYYFPIMSMSDDPFLIEIEAFLERTKMTPTTFGNVAAKDPAFVFDLRAGRECRRATREKIIQFMQSHASESAA